MEAPEFRVLWFDSTVSVKEAELPPVLKYRCRPIHCTDAARFDALLATDEIDFVLFDFDYPDRSSLRLFREVKARHASLPFVMMTLQHSEALAIWAFRNKVWDYLVKPVSRREAERCLAALSRVGHYRRSQTSRQVAAHTDGIPSEVHYVRKPDEHSLSRAIFYVEKYSRSKIRSEDVAAYCGLSPFRFSKLFKEVFGITFRDYLVGYRLREACRLLMNPNVNVADVAFTVGFNDPSYFTRIFRQRVGVAPSQLIGDPGPMTEEANRRISEQLPEIAS